MQDSSPDDLRTWGLEAWVYCAALITPALNSARTDLTNSSPNINTKRQRVGSSQTSNITRAVCSSAGWPVCSETQRDVTVPVTVPDSPCHSKLCRDTEATWGGAHRALWPRLLRVAPHQCCRPSLPVRPCSYSLSLRFSFLFRNTGIIPIVVVEELGRLNDLIFAKSIRPAPASLHIQYSAC